MSTLAYSLGEVAPIYNLALVAIVIIMFVYLFTLKNKSVFLLPWKLIFVSILIYVVEELLTILNKHAVISTPRILNAFFELLIISIFIYALLAQKEYLKNNG
jgi:hypothetical protein